VCTTRFEKVATPLATETVVVPEVKLDWGLPAAIDIATEPEFKLVSTLPYWSSTETATLGMTLPAVPGPGVAGVKANVLAAAGLIVTLPSTAVVAALVATLKSE
jgi:hypothetical protein